MKQPSDSFYNLLKQGARLMIGALLISSSAMAQVWDGTVADSYAGGSGTETDPYLISTCGQFAFFANNVRDIEGYSKGKFFLVTNDLVFNEGVYERIEFRGASNQLEKPDWPRTIEGYSEWIKAPEELRHSIFKPMPYVGAYYKETDGPEIFTPFEGSFDGGGHVFYGVFQDAMDVYGAIFPSVEGGCIKNLGIEDSYFVHNSQYGSFAGRMIDSHMINCYIRHSYVESGGSYGGGLVGMMRGSSTLRNCYVDDCVVMGKNGVGGLIGRVGANQANTCVVENCYANAYIKVKKTEHGAYIDGVTADAIVRNGWYTVRGKASVAIDGAQRGGTIEHIIRLTDDALRSDSLVDILNANAADIEGACRWAKNADGGPFFAKKPQIWDGSVADSYDGGDGTEENPYLIANASQWARFSDDVATKAGFSKDKFFLLTADIILNDSVYEGVERSTRQDKEDLPVDASRYRVTPCIGSYGSDTEYVAFEGTFDGGGHTISGMMGSLYRSQTYDALFRVLEGSTVKNLGVSDSYLLSNARLGALAGRMVNSRLINCHVEHSFIEGGGSQSGALVGQMLGTSQVLNSYATDVVVFGKNDMGGFIGRIGDSAEQPCRVDNGYSRVELRVKRRNHGAVSFACCPGSTVSHIYYEALGEIDHDFWTDYKLGEVDHVEEVSADDFAADALVDSLNEQAALIPGACRWKMGDGTPVHDFSSFTSETVAIKSVQSTHPAPDAIYNLCGQRLSQPRKGLVIIGRKKVFIK